MPADAALRTVASDALSFPLTAAFAARLANVTADASTGRLTLLVLGAEASELSGLSKWQELLSDSHGLGATSATILFVGPRVPKSLDGQSKVVQPPQPPSGSKSQLARGGELRLSFVRGFWHHVRHRIAAELQRPQLALAFNSGLAEHADGWLPTLDALYHGLHCPLAFTSYHGPEAELDARTLKTRLGVPLKSMRCMPNPFASRLPHLDYLFVGRTYVANAFLSVCLPRSA